jgi:hypothetical protein
MSMGFQGRSIDIAVSLLKSGSSVRLRVTGQSMKPLLPPGCLLRIKPVTGPPEVGDIVFFESGGGKRLAHRVINRTLESIQTKGDAFIHADGAVGLNRVMGKVVAVEEPFTVRLDNRLMRWTGRLLGCIYPKLYKMKMVFCNSSVNGHRRAGGTQNA